VKSRILLVDDHAVVRRGLKGFLEAKWDICGEAEDGKEAIEKAISLKPDLILMDVSMPNMNGIEAARQIRQLAPEIKIVIFTMHDSRRIAQQAQEAGADAWLVKTCGFDQLTKTLDGLLDGNHPAT
jgi:two-component system response regulator NreC